MPEQIGNTLGGELQAKSLRKEELPFPEDRDKRLGSVLSSVNVGPKSVTLLLLPYGSYISPGDLVNNFRSVVRGSEMEKTSFITAPHYCEYSLEPIGLVAKQYTIDYFGKDVVVGFELTDAGRRYGIPCGSTCTAF